MSQETFDELAEYSGTQPTSVYPGKMWKRHDGIFDREFLASGGTPIWLLCWYGDCDDPRFVSNHYRKILVVTT